MALHAEWYARHWGFGLPFEAKVAKELGDFASSLPHPGCRLLLAVRDGLVVGAIAVDGRAAPVARIRWFIVEDSARGGLGRQLLDDALAFCRECRVTRVWLTTFAGLDAARRLYERAGFVLEAEEEAASWGVTVREQRFGLALPMVAP